MKIAFLTRTWESADDPEKGLHGNNAVLRGIRAALPDHEVVHVPVPGTVWDPSSTHPPELQDMACAQWFLDHDWKQYDVLLNNEFGFAPILRLMQLPAWTLAHLDWWDYTDDKHGKWLPRFARWAESMIAPKASIIGRAPGRVVHMPYPVEAAKVLGPGCPDPLPWEERDIDVLWIGRDDVVKGPGSLRYFLANVRDGRFPWKVTACFSYMTERHAETMAMFAEQGVVDLRIGEDASQLYRRAKVVLSTSLSECYATSLVEGMVAGCIPVYDSLLTLDHIPRAHGAIVYENMQDLLPALTEAIAMGGGSMSARRAFAWASFAAEGPLGSRWNKFVKEEADVWHRWG